MGQLEGGEREQRGDFKGEPPLQASTGFRSGFGFGVGMAMNDEHFLLFVSAPEQSQGNIKR